MRLNRLTVRRFKGLADFTLEPGAANASVHGDNGTGKTTLADAFSWLLTGKDTAGRDLNPKPLDIHGQDIHNVDSQVEAELVDDAGGNPLTLRRTFHEVWTKKRGRTDREFGGHTTDFEVNGVPVPEKEYLEQVGKICTPEQARLLTDPDYFAGKLAWQKRRTLLLDVCGDVTDEDVIASDAALAELPGILQGRTLEAHKKVADARRKAVKQRQDELPARIDEARRALPEAFFDAAEDEAHKTFLLGRLESLQADIARLEAGGPAEGLRTELLDAEEALRKTKQLLDGESRAARHAEEDRIRAARRSLEEPVEAARAALRRVERDLQEAKDARAAAERGKRALEPELQQLRDAYDGLAASEWDGATCCPTCKQDLPADQVSEARGNWNEHKAAELERIAAAGKAKKADLGALEIRLAECAQREADLAEDRRLAEETLAAAEVALAEAPTLPTVWPAPDYDADPRVQEASAKVEDLRRRTLDALAGGGNAAEISRLREALGLVRVDLETTERRLANAAARVKGEARIAELETEQRALAAEWERLERELALLDAFTRAKVRLLTDRINSRFGLARFRLFKELVNGGLEECCDVTYQGVPYGAGLNTGARINVGLDIIRTLAAHFGRTLPVFADNAESVTRLLDIPSQTIRLVVAAGERELRVVTEDTLGSLFGKAAA